MYTDNGDQSRVDWEVLSDQSLMGSRYRADRCDM